MGIAADCDHTDRSATERWTVRKGNRNRFHKPRGGRRIGHAENGFRVVLVGNIKNFEMVHAIGQLGWRTDRIMIVIVGPRGSDFRRKGSGQTNDPRNDQHRDRREQVFADSAPSQRIRSARRPLVRRQNFTDGQIILVAAGICVVNRNESAAQRQNGQPLDPIRVLNGCQVRVD